MFVGIICELCCAEVSQGKPHCQENLLQPLHVNATAYPLGRLRLQEYVEGIQSLSPLVHLLRQPRL